VVHEPHIVDLSVIFRFFIEVGCIIMEFCIVVPEAKENWSIWQVFRKCLLYDFVGIHQSSILVIVLVIVRGGILGQTMNNQISIECQEIYVFVLLDKILKKILKSNKWRITSKSSKKSNRSLAIDLEKIRHCLVGVDCSTRVLSNFWIIVEVQMDISKDANVQLLGLEKSYK